MSRFEVIDTDRFDTPVSNFALKELKTLTTSHKIKDAINLMQKQGMGSVAVSNDGTILGIFTERDLLYKFFDRDDLSMDTELSEIMTSNPVVFTKNNTIAECIYLICRQDFRHIPIIDDNGKATHMVSINDVLRFIMDCFPNDIAKHGTIFKWNRNDVQAQEESFSFERENDAKGKLSGNIFLTPLRKVLFRKAVKVDQELSVQETAKLIKEAKCGSVIVTNYETTVKGIITERDFLLKVYDQAGTAGIHMPVKNFMTHEPHCLFTGHLLAHAINNMFTCHYRNIILVDEERFPLGIITLHDVLLFIAEKIFPSEELDIYQLSKL